MKYSAALVIKLSICIMLLSICAIGIALSGRKEVNTSIVYPGVPRQAVISGVDEPESSATNNFNSVRIYTIDQIFGSSLR